MPYPDTAEGFMVTDLKNWSTFTKQEFKLKPFEDRDIDVAIDACGVCASDVHTISGGWTTDVPLPLCVGHEVIGRAIKVGKDVKTVKVGDRVGVGAQIGADLTCKNCKANQENYCPNQIDTYGANYPDGTQTQGGYSSHMRAHEYFTFRIPDKLETAIAAPMLCAGLTTYSPLVRHGVGPGKKVGIIGIGGLGHFGLLWAKALGAEVYALSHSPTKKDDALAMGVKEFICTADKDWATPYKFTFDLLLNCSNATHRFDLPTYMGTLVVGGSFHMVGFPNEDLPRLNAFALSREAGHQKLVVGGSFHMVGFPNEDLPRLNAFAFAPNGCSIGASHIGNRQEMTDMLDLAAKQDIKSWVQTVDVSEKGCKEAVERVYSGENVRYRLTLVGFDKVFGKRD